MRLLDTTTFKPYEFFGANIPPYAILSHRWGDSEVAFKDLENGNCVRMAGWAKITGCCARAAQDGWKYAWIDSCCIDKYSSAELTEAINSMFDWYRDAEVCYAYLSDVFIASGRLWSRNSAFRRSKWFTRGWTLQELLAPAMVIFFDHDWIELGTKTSLDSILSDLTGIEHLFDFDKASIAQKMSWASKRKTLRAEDQAYCLLGLFGVNMPLLYGEGEKAFLRLQTEIIKISDDESIFAWTEKNLGWDGSSGLLAKSPAAFTNSGDIELYPNRRSSPYSMTNKGLQITLAITPAEGYKTLPPLPILSSDDIDRSPPDLQAPIYCIRRNESRPIALYFRRLDNERDAYTRIHCDEFAPIGRHTATGKGQKTVLVPQEWNSAANNPSTGILIYGKIQSIHSQTYKYHNFRKSFYPGLFLSNRFYSEHITKGIAPKAYRLGPDLINLRESEEDGIAPIEIRLWSGVALLEYKVSGYEVSGTMFGLEIHNPTGRPPGVALIMPVDKGLSPKAMLEKRLKEPTREEVQHRTSGVLTSGALVSVAMRRSKLADRYLLEVTIDGGKANSPVNNRGATRITG